MKRRIIICISLLVITSINMAAAANPAAKSIPSHPIKLKYDPLKWTVPLGEKYRVQLKNGLTAYVATDSLLPLVQITGYVKYGSLLDPSGKEGLSDLLTNLMRSGGTQKYPADTLDELIDMLAMNIGLSADESQLKFSASFLAEYTSEALDILQQILFHPAFEEKKLEKERKIFLQSIQHRFDNPGPILDAAYHKVMYSGGIPGKLTTSKSIKAITRKNLIDLHKKIFSSRNIILSAAGSFERKTMLSHLEEIFPPGGASISDSTFPDIKIKTAIKSLVVQKQISQAYVRLGLPLFRRPHPDYYTMSVLNLILGGGGFTSRLGTKIRSDAGLTYSIYSHAESNYTYPATFYIDFYTKNASFTKAVLLTIEEVRKLVSDGITDEELANAKSTLISELPSMFRSPFDIVSTYAWNEYYGRSPDHFKTYTDKIKAVTRDDISRVAKQYLVPENFTYTVVGDTSALMKQGDKEFSLSKIKSKTVTTDSLTLMP